MWQVRFGSCSMRSTSPLMPSLSRRKSMMRYFCFCPAALVARGDAADVVAARVLLLLLGERLVRAALPQVRLVELDAEARARRSRLHLDDWHV
jgi:hypothetical protein